jgi:predicted metalloprotease with PDZ domain
VEFFVDETRSLAQFKDDWTATHEFSHLLLPYVSSRDRWLSEGMASYYQNVLRARNGNLTERDAWQKLHNGFQRGEQGTRDRTLADAVRSGRGATMRIYWTGAALMLMADTRLRALSDGRQSLDTALAGLQECCLQTSHSWRAREVLSQLDQLTGTSVFMDLYREHVFDDEFPDVTPTYRELGLEFRFNRVRLVQDAPLVDVREAIMGG